jgi:predicted TIM-barrel fold metal-dependent hydrolase
MTSTEEANIPVCAAFDPNPKKPKLITPPPKSCDCHAHIVGPESRYPFTPNRTYSSPEASLSSYQKMLRTLGLERAVIVQPSFYGTDNRATLDAIREGGENFRAVVVVDESIDVDEITRMHELGARGVRINLLFKGGIDMSGVRTLAKKVAPFGWHLQMLIDVSEFSELDTLADLPIDVVFDHMGHMPMARGMANPGFVKMLKMLETGKAWAKLSGPYRITSEKDLPYADVTPVAKKIIATNPDRVVWATDWPHPCFPLPMPNDGDLLDLLVDWAPDESHRQKILVDNPAQLYDFKS